MNSMKKHRLLIGILITSGILAVIIPIVLVVGSKNRNKIDKATDLCNYSDEIRILNENFPSDIVVYGEDVNFDQSLNYRVITQISEENLKCDKKYKYSFFVINDRSGNLEISDEEFALCKRLCDEKDINFYYIGEHYLAHLEEFGFHSGLFRDDLCGIGYVLKPAVGRSVVQGIWSRTEEEMAAQNDKLLGQILVMSFVNNVIRAFNQ